MALPGQKFTFSLRKSFFFASYAWLPLHGALYRLQRPFKGPQNLTHKCSLGAACSSAPPGNKKKTTMQNELSSHICTAVTELQGWGGRENKSRGLPNKKGQTEFVSKEMQNGQVLCALWRLLRPDWIAVITLGQKQLRYQDIFRFCSIELQLCTFIMT